MSTGAYVYILRFHDGIVTGKARAKTLDDAILAGLEKHLGKSRTLPLLEAYAVAIWPSDVADVEEAKPLELTSIHILSVRGMIAALARYHRQNLKETDKEAVRRELIEWFDRYGVKIDFTGE